MRVVIRLEFAREKVWTHFERLGCETHFGCGWCGSLTWTLLTNDVCNWMKGEKRNRSVFQGSNHVRSSGGETMRDETKGNEEEDGNIEVQNGPQCCF